MIPYFSCLFGSSLVITTGSEGPKSIAIDQESLIRHFGISKTPKNSHNYIKKAEDPTHHFFLLYFGAY